MPGCSPVRIAVVGVGPLVGLPHAKRILSLSAAGGEVVLVAVCDLDPIAVASELGVKGYTNAFTMAKEEELHGVVIASPTHLHTPLAKQVIAGAQERNGNTLRAILVEKPIAHTVESGEELISVAKAAGVELLVGHQRRHSRMSQAAKQILTSPDFGSLRAMTGMWALLKPASYFDEGPQWRKEKGKGGPILINLIHDIDLIRHLTGQEVVSAFAMTGKQTRPGSEVEDTGCVSLTMSNGVVCSFLFSDATPSPWNYEFATGENPKYPSLPAAAKDAACLTFLGGSKSLAFPSLQTFSYDVKGQEPGWDAPLQVARGVIDESISADPLVTQMLHFAEVCRGTKAPLCTGRDGVNSLAATLAIAQSADLGRPVSPVELGHAQQA